MTPDIRVQAEIFDAGAEIDRMTAGRGDLGAVVAFIGLVRDFGPDRLSALTLEHYPGMTAAEMARIAEEAGRRWPLLALTVIHRFGRLEPGAPIVLVLAAAAHRRAAFEAAEFLMDWLKTKAPFWKSEARETGTRWVEAKVSDEDAAQRWE